MKRFHRKNTMILQLVAICILCIISTSNTRKVYAQTKAMYGQTGDEKVPATMHIAVDDKGNFVGYCLAEKGGKYRTKKPFRPVLASTALQNRDSLRLLTPPYTIASWELGEGEFNIYIAQSIENQPGQLRFELKDLNRPDGSINPSPGLEFNNKSGLFLIKNDLIIPKTQFVPGSKIAKGSTLVLKDNTIIGVFAEGSGSRDLIINIE